MGRKMLDIYLLWFYHRYMERQEKSVSIRFPVDLLEQLKQVAQENNRSLNGEVIMLVRTHVEKQRKQKGKES